MLVALYRANPDAFIGKNMNRLRAGPDPVGARRARRRAASLPAKRDSIVVAQTRDFNEYRNELAGQVAAGAAKPSAEARQSATGKITAKVEERPTAANEAKDQLKLSKADMAGGKAPAVRRRPARKTRSPRKRRWPKPMPASRNWRKT